MPANSTQTFRHDGDVSWLAANGEMVSGTWAEHVAFLAQEQANPAKAIAHIEAKIEQAKVSAPTAVVEQVKAMDEGQLQGLARAISARVAQIRLDQKPNAKASDTSHRSAFLGATGLSRACAANRNFRVAAPASKRNSIPAGLTGLARATAANKARQPK